MPHLASRTLGAWEEPGRPDFRFANGFSPLIDATQPGGGIVLLRRSRLGLLALGRCLSPVRSGQVSVCLGSVPAWIFRFFLHDEGPAGSSYPADVKPTARMAVASEKAVGSAPLLRRARAHGLAPDPVAGSRVVARSGPGGSGCCSQCRRGPLGSDAHQVSDEPLRRLVPPPTYLGAEHEEPLRTSRAELWVGGSLAPLGNSQRRAPPCRVAAGPFGSAAAQWSRRSIRLLP